MKWDWDFKKLHLKMTATDFFITWQHSLLWAQESFLLDKMLQNHKQEKR